MGKIKILVDAHVFDDTFQGTSTYILGLYSALAKDPSFEITLAARDTDRLRELFSGTDVKFVRLGPGGKLKRLLFEIPGIISRQGFQVAHFQYITPPVKKCFYVNTIHDLLFIDYPSYFPLSYRVSRRLPFFFSARRADMVCTVSNYSKEAIARHFMISPEKILVTPNAVEVPSGEAPDIRATHDLERYILYVSRVEPRKNHYLLAKCFTELGLYRNYQLVFVGRVNDVRAGKYLSYLENLPPEIRKRILHLEDLSPQALRGLYSHADLFVFPSLAEGFGIPPLEASVAGSRVLCSNQTAMRDYDFYGKYLFDPHNEEELRKKMQSALSERSYDVAGIRREVLSRYDWNSIATAFGRELKTRLHKA
jgi:glycosyltransferase involved in cell wall biosynthesis